MSESSSPTSTVVVPQVRPRLWQKRATSPKTVYPVELNNPLPNYEGPRLDPFRHRNALVDFIQLLNPQTPGEDAYVFEVIIESKRYALKVFKFYDHRKDRKILQGTKFELSEKGFIAQFDPFYSECRAYGRIEEEGKNGIVAVRAYGFMSIPADREGYMNSSPFSACDWNRPKKEYNLPIEERQPFRAIVKDLVRNKITIRHISRMREDLFTLQAMGVLVQDIEKSNYCNGKLVDFSLCWTSPHVFSSVKIRAEKEIRDEKLTVQHDFDRMLEAEGFFTRGRASAKSIKTEDTEENGLIESVEIDEYAGLVTAASGRLRRITKKPDRLGFASTR